MEDRRVKPEVRGVGVATDSEEAEVLQPDPGDRPVAKVANSAVQPRQVAGHHRHVSRMAGGIQNGNQELERGKQSPHIDVRAGPQ